MFEKLLRDKLLRDAYLKEVLILSILTIFCFGLSTFRWYHTGLKTYTFLIWNLFLAGIPWLISSFIAFNDIIKKNIILLLALLAFWLLFLPNAPYILTDLFHLKSRARIPLWFDLFLILSYAWAGLMYAIFSLKNIEKVLRGKIGKPLTQIFIVCVLFLSAFGVYLGRFLRWNSWDIVQSPERLFYDIISPFLDPLHYSGVWGVTLILGTFLNIIFWSYNNISVKA